MKKVPKKITDKKLAKATIRKSVSSRGGGIEIDLESFGYPQAKMTAYQNYLGGGMLGSIQSDCTIRDYLEFEDFSRVAEALKKYFHGLMDIDCEFEEIQTRSASAY